MGTCLQPQIPRGSQGILVDSLPVTRSFATSGSRSWLPVTPPPLTLGLQADPGLDSGPFCPQVPVPHRDLSGFPCLAGLTGSPQD